MNAHTKWLVYANAFCERIALARRMFSTGKGRLGFCNYGDRRGCGNHYGDFLARIDAAIFELQQAREIFLTAEKLRQKAAENAPDKASS